MRRGKEGGGLNEPEEEKDRCCFRGGRGALVLLLRSLSLALYSASVPGQGARRVGGHRGQTQPPTGRGEGRQDKCHKIQKGDRERENKRKLVGLQKTSPGLLGVQGSSGPTWKCCHITRSAGTLLHLDPSSA